MITLTPTQDRLLSYIKGCARSPSFDEMTDGAGFHSKSHTFKTLDILERKGYVRCIRRGGQRVARGIIPNDGPRPDLAGYTDTELADELVKRLRA